MSDTGQSTEAAECYQGFFSKQVTAAGSTIAQYVLGPIASLLDHGRDAAKKVLAG